MTTYDERRTCRICESDHLLSVLSLGYQELTGIFPTSPSQPITRGPIELVWCPACHLLQLKHSYDASEMYGENYGYRSGLNQSMVNHLTEKANYLGRLVPLKKGDVVLDIGSNDATLLKAFSIPGISRIGIDPTGNKFSQFYTKEITLIPDYFSSEAYRSIEHRPARIITSIAMFYDLENPLEFARQVESVLAADGIWHFEQSYMPSMLRLNSYDTVCHEHIEYYSLGVVKRIVESAGLNIIDVGMNNINGGSFAVTAVKRSNTAIQKNSPVIEWLLDQEDRMGLNTPRPFRNFEKRVFRHREDLNRLIKGLNADGKKVLGYGASTKGNVVLQFCGLTERDIPLIADVNPDKFGCYTPGSRIPIVAEEEARAVRPDYFLVLPWHFRDSILRREKEYLAMGGRMIFPFPEIEIV